MSRRIAVVSVARSDYGIYRPLLRAMSNDPGIELALIVAASHLTDRFGNGMDDILADGYVPRSKVDCSLASDSPGSVARSMGLAVFNFSSAYEDIKPDLIVVLGDRFEMHSAAVAAVPLLIPVAHIAGGAITQGAIDDSLRHSMTKLSHLHFPETAEQGERIKRLGEASWRIHVTGSLAIDSIADTPRLGLQEFNARFGIALVGKPILVTLHPVTRAIHRTQYIVEELLAALAARGEQILFTYPNADPAGSVIIKAFEHFAPTHRPGAFIVPNLGAQAYYSAQVFSSAMVGNSSSGLTEAVSFGLPAVNIGDRQKGRLAPGNVIQSGHGRSEIGEALAKALDPKFREGVRAIPNPYGDGNAASRMVEVLKSVDLSDRLIVKEDF